MRGDEKGPAKASAALLDGKLARLAELLDCPVEVFTDGAHAPHDVRQTRELMALWTELDSDDREEMLRRARKLAKR